MKTRHENRLREYFEEQDGANRTHVEVESRWLSDHAPHPVTEWLVDHAGDILLVTITAILVLAITTTGRSCKVTNVNPTTATG